MRRLRCLPPAAALLILAGCGSAPPAPDAPAARQPAPAAKAPVLPKAGSGRGGYYQDDGPGETPPDDLLATPDAEPKVEPYSSRGNRPYIVFGKTYTPITHDRPFKQRGIGSWYGRKFHGQRTSSGEIYDMYKMTAAHPTLPIPSYARVTNVATGKQVIVRVNDRGPFLHGRIIDLSYTAAFKLGYIGKGSAELEVERLLPDEIARIHAGKPERSAVSETLPASAVPAAAGAAEAAALPEPKVSVVELLGTPPPAASPVSPADSPPTASQQAPAPGFYLQFGAYAQAGNAEAVRMKLAVSWNAGLPPLEIAQSAGLFRVYGGPFATRAAAAEAAQQIESAGGAKVVIVQR